jgi:hypothetical protein
LEELAVSTFSAKITASVDKSGTDIRRGRDGTAGKALSEPT